MVELGGTASKSSSVAAPPQTVIMPPQTASLSPPPPHGAPHKAATVPLPQVATAPPLKAPPPGAPLKAPEKNEDEAWKDVVKLLQQAGHADRATHYALTYASLNSKVEELHKKRDAVSAAQQSLLKAAEEEGSKFAKPGQHQEGLSWALTLTKAISEQVKEKLKLTPCSQAAHIVREAHQQVTQTFEAKRKAELEEAQPNVMQLESAKRAKAMPQFPAQMTPQSMGGDLYHPKAQQGMVGNFSSLAPPQGKGQAMGGDLSHPSAQQGMVGNSSPLAPPQRKGASFSQAIDLSNSSPLAPPQGKGISFSQATPMQTQQQGALAQQTTQFQQIEPSPQNNMNAAQQQFAQAPPYNSNPHTGQSMGVVQNNGKGYGKSTPPQLSQTPTFHPPPQSQYQQPQATPYNQQQQPMHQPPPAPAPPKQYSASQQYHQPQAPMNYASQQQQHNMYPPQQQPTPQQGYYGGCGQYGKGF